MSTSGKCGGAARLRTGIEKLAACCLGLWWNCTAHGQAFLYQVTDDSGNVHVPAFVLPPSRALSESARQYYLTAPKGLGNAPAVDRDGRGIEAYRQHLDKVLMRPLVERARSRYKVQVRSDAIAGVPIQRITPQAGTEAHDTTRVLINLHGGAWMVGGGGAQGLAESIPIAALAGMQVIAVDYRQWPESRHPTATQDVIDVFSELTKTYPAENIGLFGCSAGGMLAAMVTAALLERGIKPPGAIGIYGAGATRITGDSFVLAAALAGTALSPQEIERSTATFSQRYFEGADPAKDKTLSPADHPDLLRRFPPTQLVTGARALDLSPAIITHAALVDAGAVTELHVREGMGHCFITRAELPEAESATRAIAAFFQRHLGH